VASPDPEVSGRVALKLTMAKDNEHDRLCWTVGASVAIVIVHGKSAVICYVDGNLESETVAEFRASVATLRPVSNVVFDLQQVPFVDSAGLGSLIGAARRIRESGGDAVVSRPRPSVRRAMHVTAIDRSLRIFGSVTEAEDHFSSHAAAA
jgi:anti-sigma B factor antagonist